MLVLFILDCTLYLSGSVCSTLYIGSYLVSIRECMLVLSILDRTLYLSGSVC